MKKTSQKKEVKFYLAEDIRLELNNRPIIIGLYPRDRIVITLPTDIPALSKEAAVMIPSVSILASLVGFEGSFAVNISLYAPDTTVLIENSELGHIVDEGINSAHKEANLIAKFVPFKVTQLGEYKLVVSIKETDLEYKFRIEV
ncbi:hypothetical protein [Nitrosomonas sp.]|uniref:hypothetical protein n=1 Tax=Nitrosomonas sp. TaxID=42353 RepID=UPI0025D33678|nr:hypothetical protein [Nitrosomonas sp.]